MAQKRTITTIREQVYRILRDDICQGVYAPGTRLQEVELAENLNVSRSPVREALRQLAADGLLLEIPNKGVYIKEFTVKDIEEIYDLRVMLESYGILHSDGHITSMRRERLLGLLTEMENYLEKGDLRSYTSVDERLHNHIVHLGDNSLINDPRLLEAAKRLGYRIKYVLHPIVSVQAKDFTPNDVVDIIPSIGDMSYEDLFCESALMVTDYSGVQFDFAYMRKPVLYFHSDEIPAHYEEGTFYYDTMAFGEIARTSEELTDLLIEYMEHDCAMKEKYRLRADDFLASLQLRIR